MKRDVVSVIARSSITLVVALVAPWHLHAQTATPSYPSMAPLDQYLIADRNAEIAMARSAAPDSVSRDAEVLVLGRQGYEVAVKGTNGFVCLVERSWTSPIDDPEFWNQKIRSPICLNPPGARSHLPLVIKKTESVLAGGSKAQMSSSVQAAFAANQIPSVESGAMGYMLSAQTHGNDRYGQWHPHVMFFVPPTGGATWGANVPGSPIVAFKDLSDRMTVLLIPVGKWSDGTVAPAFEN